MNRLRGGLSLLLLLLLCAQWDDLNTQNRFRSSQNDFNHGNYISTYNCLMLKFIYSGTMLTEQKTKRTHTHTFQVNLIQFEKFDEQ